MSGNAHFLSGNNGDTEDSWISVADLMAGLMMVFLLLAILYSFIAETDKKQAEQINETAREVAKDLQDIEEEIYRALVEEFQDDLTPWNATIERETLTIRFGSPENRFAVGEAKIQPEFKEILSDFWPRYIKILHNGEANGARFRDSIIEVRIEGHTSSEWADADEILSPQDAFIFNMELSQNRARNVLAHNLSLADTRSYEAWLLKTASANGLSSSKIISQPSSDSTQTEDRKKSRRVEFTIRTNTREVLSEILQRLEGLNPSEDSP